MGEGIFMKVYNIGFFIKWAREVQEISQEKLCDNICDKSTLSRLENGKGASPYVTEKLLERLGKSGELWIACDNSTESEIFSLKKEIVALNTRKEYQRAKESLTKLEQLADSKNKLLRQFILRSRALAGYPDNYPAALEINLQALRITQPKLDFNHIANKLMTLDELKILNDIALGYSESEQTETALSIFEQLTSHTVKTIDCDDKIAVDILIEYNYSRLLGRDGQYLRAILVAHNGYEKCVKFNKARYMGGLLLNMACSYYELGNKEQARSLIINAYYAYRLLQDDNSCKLVRNYALEKFGEETAVFLLP